MCLCFKWESSVTPGFSWSLEGNPTNLTWGKGIEVLQSFQVFFFKETELMSTTWSFIWLWLTQSPVSSPFQWKLFGELLWRFWLFSSPPSKLFIDWKWHAGNLVCKGLMMVRTGGFILSSNMLVVLAMDRYISISQPLTSINTLRQRKRARLMVVFAWIITVVSTVPQAIIFRVLKHPERDFYQCTTYNFFEDLASPVQVGNTTVLYLGGLTPVQWADLYHTVFNCEVFFGPIIAIIISYSKIFSVISR